MHVYTVIQECISDYVSCMSYGGVLYEPYRVRG